MSKNQMKDELAQRIRDIVDFGNGSTDLLTERSIENAGSAYLFAALIRVGDKLGNLYTVLESINQTLKVR